MPFAGITVFPRLVARYPFLELPDVFFIEIGSKARAFFFQMGKFCGRNLNSLIAKIEEMLFRDENVLFLSFKLVRWPQIVSAGPMVTFIAGCLFAGKRTTSKIVAPRKFSLDLHGIDEFVVPCALIWVCTACSDYPITGFGQFHDVLGLSWGFLIFAATECAKRKVWVRCVTCIMVNDVGEELSVSHVTTKAKTSLPVRDLLNLHAF